MRKRDIKKQFWLSEKENKLLKENSKKSGLSESSYVRNLINGYKPKEQPTNEIFEMQKQLRGIATNFNQIATKANALGFIDKPFYENSSKKLQDFMEKFEKEFLDIS